MFGVCLVEGERKREEERQRVGDETEEVGERGGDKARQR